jgi:hypothetical protein
VEDVCRWILFLYTRPKACYIDLDVPGVRSLSLSFSLPLSSYYACFSTKQGLVRREIPDPLPVSKLSLANFEKEQERERELAEREQRRSASRRSSFPFLISVCFIQSVVVRDGTVRCVRAEAEADRLAGGGTGAEAHTADVTETEADQRAPTKTRSETGTGRGTANGTGIGREISSGTRRGNEIGTERGIASETGKERGRGIGAA